MARVLILGGGYTGGYLHEILKLSGNDVISSRRTKAAALELDLSRPTTWSFQESFDFTVWMAPSPTPDLIRDFLQAKASHLGKVLCCSSTGFFESPNELHGEINENSPLDLSKPRVQAENVLFSEANAMIVHAAGIYGPNRNPQNWLASGRIQPSEKLLNLIHVGDLALFFWRAMNDYQAKSRWVLSDKHPYSWNQLYQAWAEKLRLPQLQEGSPKDSKRVNPEKTFEFFRFKPIYKDVFEGVSLGMKEDNVRQTILHQL